MAKLSVRVQTKSLPELRAIRTVQTVADLRRLFRDADSMLVRAAKMFPTLKGDKVTAVTIRLEA